jgi:hypothetical protein
MVKVEVKDDEVEAKLRALTQSEGRSINKLGTFIIKFGLAVMEANSIGVAESIQFSVQRARLKLKI